MSRIGHELEPDEEHCDDATRHASKLPSPTAWPIVLAFGITLVFAGMVTTACRQYSGCDPGPLRVRRLVS